MEADSRNHVQDLYCDLYTEDWGIRPIGWTASLFPFISEKQAAWLERSFDKFSVDGFSNYKFSDWVFEWML